MSFPPADSSRMPTAAERSREPVPAVRRVAAVLGAVIATLTALGIGAMTVDFGPLWIFDLDREWVVPAVFSAGVLGWAAFLAARLARAGPASRLRPVWWWALAVLFAFMCLDELTSIHERLEAATGVDWQLLYAPLVAVAGFGWLRALFSFRSRSGSVLWALGAAAWFVAQVFEYLQYDGDRLIHAWMIVPEESLEMTGSSLWVLALLTALHSLPDRRRDQGERRRARRLESAG